MTLPYELPPLQRTDTTRRHVTAPDGTRLALQEHHPEGRATVLFLHAFGGSHLHWNPLLDAPALAPFHLVTLDHRGHGESDRPATEEAYATGQTFADDLEAVLASFERPVHVVAHSVSGLLLGDHLAHHGPDRLASITLLNAVHASGAPLAALDHLGPAFADPDVALLYNDALADQITGWRAVNRSLSTRPLTERTAGDLLATNLLLPLPARRVLLARDADHADVYGQITTPLLLVHGEQDPAVLPAATRRLAACRRDAGVLFLRFAAHAPHWDAPDVVAGEIARFVEAATP
jgi:pimeloyl-ACP methyl ester carboxylesterase